MRISSAFNAAIFIGFLMIAAGTLIYVANLLARYTSSSELLLIGLGILILAFGLAAARLFSSLELSRDMY